MAISLLRFAIICTILCAIKAFSTVDDDRTLVQIESGLIRGHFLKSEKQNDYWAFQEIPYAAPPIGKNRFQLPKSPKSWDGVLNTTKNTKICYQGVPKFNDIQISEDCLYINVYTPVNPSNNNSLPVLLWIHGGGFLSWSGAYQYYGPKYIMDHGIVVVTINYRLGAFGFIATDDGIIPRDCGLKDQVFAMQWVKRNIAKFGGNSSHIIINGESAGSMAIGRHLIGSWEDGIELFQGVIMQSGAAIITDNSSTNATAVAVELATTIDPNFVPGNTQDLLEFLQNADAKDIEKAGINGLAVVEAGKKGQFQEFLDSNYKKVPVLIGFNSEETVRAGVSKEMLEEADADPSTLISEKVNMSPENRTIAGKFYKNVYTNGAPFTENRGAFIRHRTDAQYTTATCKQVEIGSVQVPYYLYQFAYKGELGENMNKIPPAGAEKVGHTEDLHYMWDDGINSDLSKFSEADQLTLHRFVKMWTNFVKYLDPTPEDDPLLGNIKWLTSEPDTLRYLNINDTLEMRKNPRQYKQIKPILEKYMEPPFNSFN